MSRIKYMLETKLTFSYNICKHGYGKKRGNKYGYANASKNG